MVQDFRLAHTDVHTPASDRKFDTIARTRAELRRSTIGLAEPPVDKRLLCTTQHSLQCVCALPKGHELANNDIVTIEHLWGLPFIGSAPDRPFHHSIRRLLDERGAIWKAQTTKIQTATEGVAKPRKARLAADLCARAKIECQVISQN